MSLTLISGLAIIAVLLVAGEITGRREARERRERWHTESVRIQPAPRSGT